jgi:ABC-type sugar transport system ATPase subunit
MTDPSPRADAAPLTDPVSATGVRSDAAEALRIDGLHKSFGDLEVLRGIDLRVVEHEVVCLIGASGSGKSTLLRCVNLLEEIDAGQVYIRGEEITAPKVDIDRVRRRIGIVFQAYNLFPHMSVIDNVALAPRIGTRRHRPSAAPLRRWHRVGPHGSLRARCRSRRPRSDRWRALRCRAARAPGRRPHRTARDR